MPPLLLKDLRGRAHPEGNRVDLSWEIPDDSSDDTVFIRVLRRTDGYAKRTSGQTRRLTASSGRLLSDTTDDIYIDRDLTGESVYYYTLLPFRKGEDPDKNYDPRNRVAVLTTAPYDYARSMYELLPAIYRRYDEAGDGALRRFLEICGAGLDRIHSLSRALRNLKDVSRVHADLLPLLADWIGWQTNFRQSIGRQRNDLRDAPHLFRGIGTAPAVDAIVRRMVGWDSQTREFTHNVFTSNDPERMNLWHAARSPENEDSWEPDPRPLSFEYATIEGGRPWAVRDARDRLWFVYHGRRLDQWKIFVRVREADGHWQPGRPLEIDAALARHPVAAMRAEMPEQNTRNSMPNPDGLNASGINIKENLWIFWDVYETHTSRWRIEFRVNPDGPVRILNFSANNEPECRRPAIAGDGQGGFFLFWQERANSGSGPGRLWRCRYAHFSAGADPTDATDFPPDDDGANPRVEADLFLLLYGSKLMFAWSRRDRDRRYEIAWRVLDPASGTWGPIQVLPKAADDAYDDREPAAIARPEGGFDLFFASNRDRGWSIWNSAGDDPGQHHATARRVTDASFSRRAPLPFRDGETTHLWYRSCESVEYSSDARGSRTLDLRYAGSVSVDTTARPRNALHGNYYDTRRYTYDTGRENDDWYSFHTVGIFLRPKTDDKSLIVRNQFLLRNVLRQFLPINLRLVFIVEPSPYVEWVYEYDRPDAVPRREIEESYSDDLKDGYDEQYVGLSDEWRDAIPGWTYLRAWSREFPDHRTTDFRDPPVDLRYRVWHTAVEPGAPHKNQSNPAESDSEEISEDDPEGSSNETG